MLNKKQSYGEIIVFTIKNREVIAVELRLLQEESQKLLTSLHVPTAKADGNINGKLVQALQTMVYIEGLEKFEKETFFTQSIIHNPFSSNLPQTYES